MDERPWVLATRIALVIVTVLVAVLVVTGVMLVFGYRPDVTAAYALTQGLPSHSHARSIHRLASQLLFPAFGGLAIAASGLALVRHRARRLVPVVIAGVAVLIATFTGFVLPWDQLALNRVTVGTNVTGYRMILFDSNVKYVLVGNTEIGPSTLARWFWLHVVGTTLLLVVPLTFIALQTRARRRARNDPPAVSPESP
jgi:quinol-cytochrome oxidoreductase complex cytochrome b subunit